MTVWWPVLRWRSRSLEEWYGVISFQWNLKIKVLLILNYLVQVVQMIKFYPFKNLQYYLQYMLPDVSTPRERKHNALWCWRHWQWYHHKWCHQMVAVNEDLFASMLDFFFFPFFLIILFPYLANAFSFFFFFLFLWGRVKLLIFFVLAWLSSIK